MRKLCYSVAMSLDGMIAGPEGEFDWIPQDSDIDFQALFGRFDTMLVGRKTWEITRRQGGVPFDLKTFVCSRTLTPSDVSDETLTDDVESLVRELKSQEGGDIWLMGGGQLFRELLGAGLVDEVEAAVVPILLGRGIPFLPDFDRHVRLELRDVASYPGSGIVMTRYRVGRAGAA